MLVWVSQTLSEVKSKWSAQSGRYSTKWCPIPHNKCYSGTCVVLILPGGTRLHYTHMRVHHLKRIQMTFCCRALPLWSAMAMTGICFNSSGFLHCVPCALKSSTCKWDTQQRPPLIGRLLTPSVGLDAKLLTMHCNLSLYSCPDKIHTKFCQDCVLQCVFYTFEIVWG